jgi:spermidine/putrescine transport system substrate-binding protein
MRKILLAFVFVLMTAMSAWSAGELNLYIWSEYMGPEIIPNFEKETGVKVRVDYYETMEDMMAKLQAGGMSQYDVVVPTDYGVPAMIKLGLLKELDHSKIPNMKNLNPKFVNAPYDPQNAHTVAYQWGTLGMIYNKNKIEGPVPSWSVMFDESKQVGPFVLLDSMREMLGIAQCYLGLDVNTTDTEELKKVAGLMLAAKKSANFQGFDVGVGGRSKVLSGGAVAAITYNGDGLRGVEEDPENVAFANPAEGTVIWVDNMAIPANAPNPEAAYQFINYILDAKVGAGLSNWTRYATPNDAAKPFISPEDVGNIAIYPTSEYMEKLQFLNDLGDNARIYDELWTMIKTR